MREGRRAEQSQSEAIYGRGGHQLAARVNSSDPRIRIRNAMDGGEGEGGHSRQGPEACAVHEQG
jgi:hypothetical protein